MSLNFQKLGYLVRTINEETIDKLDKLFKGKLTEVQLNLGVDFYCLQLDTDGFTAVIKFANEAIWHSDEWEELKITKKSSEI